MPAQLVHSTLRTTRVSSPKALPFPTVGRGSPDDLVARHEDELGEPFGQLARLGVAEPYPISPGEGVGSGTLERGLHLARALGAHELQTLLLERGGHA